MNNFKKIALVLLVVLLAVVVFLILSGNMVGIINSALIAIQSWFGITSNQFTIPNDSVTTPGTAGGAVSPA